jgi:hypothetical protein
MGHARRDSGRSMQTSKKFRSTYADGWSAGPRPDLFSLEEPPIFDVFKFIDKQVNFPLGLDPPCPTSINALEEYEAKRARNGF